jgi:hypothetical protein
MVNHIFSKNLAYIILILLAIACATIVLTAGEKNDAGKSPGFMGIRSDGNKITEVVKGSPAEKAGLKAGDVLIELGGKKISESQPISSALSGKYAGDKVKAKIMRDGKKKTLTITLGKRPAPTGPGGFRPLPTNKPNRYKREGEPLAKDKSLEAGLKWIASQQNDDGSFPVSLDFSSNMRFYTSIASLAGMALMLDNEFDAQAEKALEYILKSCHDDGYIYHGGKPSFKGMWEHGFATQFLAEILIRKKKAGKDTKDLEKKLRKAVELIVKTQNLEGGWGYRALPDPHAEIGPNSTMLDALLVAKKASIEVSEDVIGRGLKSQCVLMLKPGKPTFQGEWRSFSYEANAFVLSSLLGWKNRPETEVYKDALGKISVSSYLARYTEQTRYQGAYWSTGNHTLGLYYSALAYRRAGESFKDKFEKWHGEVVSGLAKFQNEKGTWKGWFGDVYGSAFVCLTLGTDTDRLATYTAADESGKAEKPAEPENAVKVTLKSKLKLDYNLKKPATRHNWQGFSKTVSNVGLEKGEKNWPVSEIQNLFPETAIGEGSAWEIPGDFVIKFFATFNKTARGMVTAKVIGREGNVLEIELRALVKLGKDGSSHILTSSLKGNMKVDADKGKILILEMETVSGCIAVRMARSAYVALNDTILSVKNKTVKEDDGGWK